MSNSQLATVTLLSPHKVSPRNAPITKGTIHHAANGAAPISVEVMLAWLAGPVTPSHGKRSATFVVGNDGRIGRGLDEGDRPYTSSSGANDNAAITIEVINNGGAPDWSVSDAALEATIDLLVDCCKRNPGIIQKDGTLGIFYDGTPGGSLTRHNMFAATTCPGPYLQRRFPYIVEQVNKKLKEDADMPQDGELAAKVADLANALNYLTATVTEIGKYVTGRYMAVGGSAAEIEVPKWGAEAVRDAVRRGIIDGRAEGDMVVVTTPLSWQEVRSIVMDYRRERAEP